MSFIDDIKNRAKQLSDGFFLHLTPGVKYNNLDNQEVPREGIIAQAQLQQLQQVAANTRRNADAADRIYELVNKVVDKGGNKLRI